MNAAARARELLRECEQHEDGSVSRLATAEAAVRFADVSADRRLQIDARNELISAATFAGRMERSMTAFAWNLAHYEEEDWTSDAVWFGFQWIAEDAPLVHTIARADIEDVLDQMQQVYQRNNWWMYPVHMARFRSGVVFGEEPDSNRVHLEAFEVDYARTDPSPHYEHVRAVARARVGDVGHVLGSLVARLDNGAQSEPPEYPNRSHAFVTLPLFLQGRVDDARAHFRSALRLCTGNRVFLRELARLLVFAKLDDRPEEIARLLEHHLAWALESYDHWSAMLWFTSAAVAAQRLEAATLRP